MSKTPTLIFASAEGTTMTRVNELFSKNRAFFEARGVTSDRDLRAVIEWKYPFKSNTAALSSGDMRAIEFSEGFYVNRLEQRMCGYTITSNGRDTFGSVFDTSSPLGVA